MKFLFILLCFCLLTLFGSGQIIPRVHFNHVFLVIDSADLNAIKNSDFIKNKFAGFFSRTTSVDSGRTWTGSYMYGVDSYFEIFDPAGVDDSLGNCGVGFSVDKGDEIHLLDSLLKRNYKTEFHLMEKIIDNEKIPWVDVLEISDSIFFSKSHITWWIMKYRRELFDHNHFTYNGDSLFTRENYLKHFDQERKNKILKNFTGITFSVTEEEKQFFTNFLLRCGYRREDMNTLISPDGFAIRFSGKRLNERYSIRSLEFEANNTDNKTIVVSPNVKITLAGVKGEIIFE